LEGAVEFSGLPRADWGFEWRDARAVFNDGFGYFNFAMPDHRSIFTDLNMYDYVSGGRINAQAYFEAPLGADPSYGLVGDWLLDPRPISSHLNYRLGMSAGMRRYTSDSTPVFVNELYADLDLGSRSWGKKTTMAPELTNIFSWDSSGFAENSMRADMRLEHRVRPSFIIGVDYGAEWRQGSTARDGLQQVLALDMRANHGSKWSSFLTANYDLTRSDLYGYLSFDYSLDKDWRARLNATHLQYNDSTFDDLELSLGRAFAGREVNLVYSTATGRFSLSLGGFALK